MRRLALDRVLFQFLLRENETRHTNHFIILGFFLIVSSEERKRGMGEEVREAERKVSGRGTVLFRFLLRENQACNTNHYSRSFYYCSGERGVGKREEVGWESERWER